MTKHPETKLSVDDIPAAVWKNVPSFAIRRRSTGGFEILRSLEGEHAVVDWKPTEQAAIRHAIRLQKKANANA